MQLTKALVLIAVVFIWHQLAFSQDDSDCFTERANIDRIDVAFQLISDITADAEAAQRENHLPPFIRNQPKYVYFVGGFPKEDCDVSRIQDCTTYATVTLFRFKGASQKHAELVDQLKQKILASHPNLSDPIFFGAPDVFTYNQFLISDTQSGYGALAVNECRAINRQNLKLSAAEHMGVSHFIGEVQNSIHETARGIVEYDFPVWKSLRNKRKLICSVARSKMATGEIASSLRTLIETLASNQTAALEKIQMVESLETDSAKKALLQSVADLLAQSTDQDPLNATANVLKELNASLSSDKSFELMAKSYVEQEDLLASQFKQKLADMAAKFKELSPWACGY